MLKILVPVDGSEQAERAVAHLLTLRDRNIQPDIHLLNVRIPIESGHVRMFVAHEELEDYYREEGLAALAHVRRMLDEAGVPYTHHIAVGHTAETIARYAGDMGFDQIVMGSHGHSGLGHLLLGSVTSEVIRLTAIPVTVVK